MILEEVARNNTLWIVASNGLVERIAVEWRSWATATLKVVNQARCCAIGNGAKWTLDARLAMHRRVQML